MSDGEDGRVRNAEMKIGKGSVGGPRGEWSSKEPPPDEGGPSDRVTPDALQTSTTRRFIDAQLIAVNMAVSESW